MRSQLKILPSAPGEATVVLIGNAQYYGNILTITFPQFSSIPSQKVLNQSVDGEDLLLTFDADSLGDILEPDSPYQIKIPELEIINTVIWPEIVGKRGESKNVIHTVGSAQVKETFATEQRIDLKDEIEEQTSSLPSSLVNNNKQEYIDEVMAQHDEEVPLVLEPSKKHHSSMPVFILSIVGICILLGGGAIAYIKLKPNSEAIKEHIVKKEETKIKPTKSVENKESPSKPVPSFTQNLQKMSVLDVINQALNTAIITQEGERRIEVKQYDDGVLLLENAASKGDTLAMLKLGLLYDPVDFKTGGAIPSPDMRESARYLQKAAEGGLKEANSPRAALKEWLIKKADEGDDMARLTLKDFWK